MRTRRLRVIAVLLAMAIIGVDPSGAAPGDITEFPLPTSPGPTDQNPVDITSGPDGNLWFTEFSGNRIGGITPAGVITRFPLPNPTSAPYEITIGPDGNMWFTEFTGNRIGRITPGGTITEFPLPNPNSVPLGITSGSDGNLWFTEDNGNRIGRISPAGTITEFELPNPFSWPRGIVAGPGGNMWFAEFAGRIGRISPAGAITEFPLPPSTTTFGITAGPDGNLWFSEENSNRIGRISPVGVITEFPLPEGTRGIPWDITTGPDGNLWFTEFGGSIGRITPAGAITEFPLPDVQSGPRGIAAGPDGNLWFVEDGLGPVPSRVGRIEPGGLVGQGGRYTPLTPARILDTRDGTGGIAGPIGSGATVQVQVTGQGGVPFDGVSAVAVNVTATQPTAAGFLTLYPNGGPLPLASNLNFTPAKTVANLVVVKVGTGGKVSMFNYAGATEVIVDVAGWFSASGSANAGRYTAVPPARILDTRDASGGGVRLGAGASLDLQVSGRGGVPAAGAAAAVVNATATGTTATSFLTVYPTGEARPAVSNLNFGAGETVANRVMAKLGTGGKVTVYNHSGSTDVVVDVGGWFSDASLAGTTGLYTALAPARILDTRDATGGIAGPLGAGSTAEVQVTGRGGVPATGVSAVVLNATITQPAGAGWLTISPAGTPTPLASDLNYIGGETRPNLVVVGLGPGGRLNLFTLAAGHVIFDVAGWFS